MSACFSFKELFATSKGLNIPPQYEFIDIIDNLDAVCINVLEPARKLFGKPITVNSGYRSKAVNDAVGGSPNSQHMKGEAVDVTTGTIQGNKMLFDIIAENCEFDQLISECKYKWIHVSYCRNSINRQQILYF